MLSIYDKFLFILDLYVEHGGKYATSAWKNDCLNKFIKQDRKWQEISLKDALDACIGYFQQYSELTLFDRNDVQAPQMITDLDEMLSKSPKMMSLSEVYLFSLIKDRILPFKELLDDLRVIADRHFNNCVQDKDEPMYYGEYQRSADRLRRAIRTSNGRCEACGAPINFCRCA